MKGSEAAPSASAAVRRGEAFPRKNSSLTSVMSAPGAGLRIAVPTAARAFLPTSRSHRPNEGRRPFANAAGTRRSPVLGTPPCR